MTAALLLRRTVTATLALSALALGACDRAATAPEVAPDVVIAEMIMVDDGGTAIFSHIDHWHGFPVVPASGSVSLQKYFVARGTSADDHDMPSRDQWFTLADKARDIRVVVTIQDTTLARWTGDRVNGRLEGRGRRGASSMTVRVLRNNTTLKEFPPLSFTVR
ncbi:MAG: hypothetical protein MUF00_04550 [Gemmatimonadaceae bacterium]|jgi:hypothetical protein|nr:hypothetical protein [Gemmatimonadaceae bacterium]